MKSQAENTLSLAMNISILRFSVGSSGNSDDEEKVV